MNSYKEDIPTSVCPYDADNATCVSARNRRSDWELASWFWLITPFELSLLWWIFNGFWDLGRLCRDESFLFLCSPHSSPSLLPVSVTFLVRSSPFASASRNTLPRCCQWLCVYEPVPCADCIRKEASFIIHTLDDILKILFITNEKI